MSYLYGMRNRPFGPLCQPRNGLIGRVETMDGEPIAVKYWDIVEYDRPLTLEEMQNYELDLVQASEESMRELTAEEQLLLDDYLDNTLAIITKENDGRSEYWRLSTPEDDTMYYTTESLIEELKWNLTEMGVM